MSLVDAVLDLPGLCPGSAALAALARERNAAACVRSDPAAVLFLARYRGERPNDFFADPLDDSSLLAAIDLVEHGSHAFIDWSAPGNERLWRESQAIASLAESLARLVGVSPQDAFCAGLLAPLGWLGVAAVQPELIGSDTIDAAALCRRLVRAWRLPAWLGDVVAHLDWDVELVARLGVDVRLAAVVQLAVSVAERGGRGLGLKVGTRPDELLGRLKLIDEDVGSVILPSKVPTFENPRTQSLLADVLRLTLENRRRREAAWIESLHADVERLENALTKQIADEGERLKRQKLAALAEFAGGAGHEINNPLAVISGQAQYILKQLARAEELLLEDPTPAAMLEAIKSKLTRPLQTIVGQSLRIHQVIVDLMQFARPQPPRETLTPVSKLIAESLAAVRMLADDRHVRLVCPETPSQLSVQADASQIKVALTNLLRNAIEAAPAEGWASIRVERNAGGDLAFVVDDNGPGPSDIQKEHLFDPFFSGRSAGRGRGLGLSTSWRLARQHGGDLALDTSVQGVTRFVLTLPATDVVDNHGAVGKREAVGYHLSGIG